MTSIRECAPARPRRSTAPILAASLLLLAAVPPLAAQIRQAPPPPTAVKPPIDPSKMLQLPKPDLLIESVTIADNLLSNPVRPSTVANLVVRNAGPADAVFPAGSVIFRAEPAPGGATFQAMNAPGPYTIAAGSSVTLSTSVPDLCAPAQPATVSFVVDPAGAVTESNETNNRKAVASVYPFSKGDMTPLGMRMWSLTETGSDAGPIPGSAPADLNLDFENTGTLAVILCPGVTLMRETETPLSTKKGFREVKYTGSTYKLFMPGATMSVVLKGAFQPGDLPPGTYTWKVMLNPDGRIAEASKTNDGASAVIQIK